MVSPGARRLRPSRAVGAHACGPPRTLPRSPAGQLPGLAWPAGEGSSSPGHPRVTREGAGKGALLSPHASGGVSPLATVSYAKEKNPVAQMRCQGPSDTSWLTRTVLFLALADSGLTSLV